MAHFTIFLLIVFVCTLCSNEILSKSILFNNNKKKCGYLACGKCDHKKLNIHILASSHNNKGNRTIDQYYNQTARNIFRNVIKALLENQERRFFYAETTYFKKYWNEAHKSEKETIRQLVNNGRLEFVNGAWTINDEATTHYQSIIDQFTSGLRFLNDAIGICANTKITWQTDTYGHSSEYASLVAQFGYDAFFMDKMHHLQKYKFQNSTSMDFMWTTNSKLGGRDNIFTSVSTKSFNANEFPFHIPQFPQDSLKLRENEFIKLINTLTHSYPTNNILIRFDYDFKQAEENFKAIDNIINYFQNITVDGKVTNLFYSTPTCYAKAVFNELSSKDNKVHLKNVTGDFYPYAEKDDLYLSGFYTTKPTTKKFERLANNFLQITKQLATSVNVSYHNENLGNLREAVGILQSHAITGTQTEFVREDYHKILAEALEKADNLTINIIRSLISKEHTMDIKSCGFLNISYCSNAEADEFLTIVYNPLSRTTTHYVELPVNFKEWKITDHTTGTRIPYIVTTPLRMPRTILKAKYQLNFAAKNLPPLGFKIYTVKSEKDNQTSYRKEFNTGVFGFEKTSVNIDSNGYLSEITINNLTLEVRQEFWYYTSSRRSGAYIFSPIGPAKQANENELEIPILIELNDEFIFIHQLVCSWITQIIKIYKNESYIQFDWRVGGLKKHSEVVTRFSTNLSNNGTFYTDSNGRHMIKRVTRPNEISANYYPVTTKISIKDEEKKIQFNVLTDRAQGGTSLKDGQIELMVHRRTNYDDNFGVGEPLNELKHNRPLAIRGKHLVSFGRIYKENDTPSSPELEKDILQRNQFAPWIFVSKNITGLKHSLGNLSLMKRPLPKEVQLLTLEPWRKNKLLLRFEHIFEAKETEEMSRNVVIDLKDLFTFFKITRLQEMTLAGNEVLSESQRLPWPETGITKNRRDDPELRKLVISLKPMEIRTFMARIEYYANF